MSHQSTLISDDILAYLKQHENKELLRFLTCGNVDDGKSTLIGRLLFDAKMIFEDQLAAIENDSIKSGTQGEKIDLALLVDGLAAEREQGITIDVAYRYFSTEKRKFIIADTPGHEQYTRNMATGASTCDLAIILIDARYGVQTQTKRHSYIASLLGIKHIIVAINKMDLEGFSEQKFNDISQDYLTFSEELNIPDIQCVPISALDGDNIVNRSQRSSWYTGQTLMEMLETVKVTDDKDFDRFRFPIQYVNRPNLDFRGFCGTIASGSVRPGDSIMALPSRKLSTIDKIVTADGNLNEAHIGQAVTLTLADEIDISRGDMIVHIDDIPTVSNKLNTEIVWMSEDPMTIGKSYDIKLSSSMTSGAISKIHHQIDVNTFHHNRVLEVNLNEIALCELTLSKPIAFDSYQINRATGSFIIIDRISNVTVAAGMIVGKASDNNSDFVPVTTENKGARFKQRPSIIAINGTHAEFMAIHLDRRLFEMGHVASISIPDHASALKSAGLIVLVEGGVDYADISLATDNENLDSMIATLQEKGII
jgi:bifunctional enzyme CysN/CysC